MSRAASPFSPRTVLALLAVGAAAFLLLLYAIAAGWDGSDDRDGGAHAASNSLNGFSGLARLLEAQGHEVSLSRSEARLDEEGLLVLTPRFFADGARISEIIQGRRYVGPTLLILPKWFAMPTDQVSGIEAPAGWVILGAAQAPEWIEEIEGLKQDEVRLEERARWYGLGLDGVLPDPKQSLGIRGEGLVALVGDRDGDALAGYLYDYGAYPVLAESAGVPPLDPEAEDTDDELWPVVIVAEPDLMNNYGMADYTRAELAHAIVDAALEDYELEVVFDLTLPGLGQSENLLTLAFRPPFLAATLCLLLAALVIAWRAFRRFGPPVAEAPALAMGKRQLARNGAGLIERARRLHLLGPPYAALVSGRIAAALGIREADAAAREAAIGRALAARGVAGDYPERAEALRRARHRSELLRAAGALHAIERTVNP